MIRTPRLGLASLFLLVLPAFASGQDNFQAVSLWKGQAPGALGNESKDNPEGLLYLPPAPPTHPQGPQPRSALVVLPGGGYRGLAIDHEGHQIARWANSMGMVAFVCKYRTRKDGYGHPAPMLDAQRAIRLVRAHAETWNISPNRVGVIGFSAGGHLASTVLTHFDSGSADATDPIARLDSRPDFGILCYPVISFNESFAHAGSRTSLLGADPDPKLLDLLENQKQVTPQTPPTFLFHTQEDTTVLPENSLVFYTAMVKNNVPGELHFFQKGKHGVGLGKGIPGTEKWPELCRAWLTHHGFAP